MTQPTTPIGHGPDFSNCGNPVNWTDQQPLDERFVPAITNAASRLGVDIELMKWSPDDPLNDEYVKLWNGQLGAIRRHVAGMPNVAGLKATVARRTDKGDGYAKCYIRFTRQRPKAVAA